MLIISVFLLSKIKSLNIVVNTDDLLPSSHPYVQTQKIIENIFGNKNMVVIGIHSKTGSILKTEALEKIKNITDELAENPNVI